MDMTYYSAIIFIEIFAAIVMFFLMSNNLVLNKTYRRVFCLEFVILIAIVVTEWLNTYLNGTPDQFKAVHYFVKFIEFSLTPALPCVLIICFNETKTRIIAKAIMFGNMLLQLFSIPFRFIFYMDDTNTYTRSSGYPVFVTLYAFSTAMLIMEIIVIGRRYQNSNSMALWVGCLFAISGVGLQLVNSEVRTSWLSVEMSLIMSYVYIEGMLMQNDRLTTMLNRFAYEKHIEEIHYGTYIIVFDVDDFKSINDSYGHTAGDSSLVLVSGLIKKYFGKEGYCYRIGGDEFCVILRKKSYICKNRDSKRLDEVIAAFKKGVARLRQEDPRITGVSVGYAGTWETETIDLAFQIADKNMYLDKENKNR